MFIEYPFGTSQVMRDMKKEAIRLGLTGTDLPSTGSYTLDLNLSRTPNSKNIVIAIIGPAKSGKTIIANAIKSCFKEHLVIEDGSYKDIQKIRNSSSYDCVIAIITKNDYTPSPILYLSDYTFETLKIEKSITKVCCTKNRYRKLEGEFYLHLMYKKGEMVIEEI